MTDDPTEPDPPRSPAGDEVQRLHVVGEESYANWDEIYLDNVVRIYRLLYSKVGNRQDAEDLTTEVFMAALGPMRVSASRGEVRAYLAATSRTVLASYWRRRLGLQVTSIDPDVAANYLAEPPAESDAPARAQLLLEGLPERHRRILELRFLEACSIKEAAHKMGITVANAKVLQHRALKMAAAHGAQP